MIYTGNVILTKNPKTIEDFFTGKATLGQLEQREDKDTFLFSNGLRSNLIHFSDSRSLDTGKFIINLDFIDPDKEFELRSFRQTVDSNLSLDPNEFVGDSYLLTYGSGSDFTQWSSPFQVNLFSIDFSASEGRLFKLIFNEGDMLNSFKNFDSKELIGWDKTTKTLVKSKTYKYLVNTNLYADMFETMQVMMADAFVEKEKLTSGFPNIIFLPNTLTTESLPEPLTFAGIAEAELGTGPSFLKAKRDVAANYKKITRLKNLGVQFTNAADPKTYTEVIDSMSSYIAGARTIPEQGLVFEDKVEDVFTYNILTPIAPSSKKARQEVYKVYRSIGDPESKIIAFEETQQDLLLAWAEAFKDAPKDHGPIQQLKLEGGQVLPTLVVGDIDLIARYLYLKAGAPKRQSLLSAAEKFFGNSFNHNKKIRIALQVNGAEMPDELKLSFGDKDSLITKIDISTKESYLKMLQNAQESILTSKNLKKKIHDDTFVPSPGVDDYIGNYGPGDPRQIAIQTIQASARDFKEQSLRDTLVTSEYITNETSIPILLNNFKGMYRSTSIETVPLFQYSGMKLLRQYISLEFKETPIFGSKSSDLDSSFFSGKYIITGYSHSISSRDMVSTFTMKATVDEKDLAGLLEIPYMPKEALENYLDDPKDGGVPKSSLKDLDLNIEQTGVSKALPQLFPKNSGELSINPYPPE